MMMLILVPCANQKYSVNSAENATSILYLSSAAASLPHPGEVWLEDSLKCSRMLLSVL